jgi:hypothetical protein
MAAEAWRTPTYVDRDIEDRPRGHAQQRDLRKRRNLKVETANNLLARRQRVVVLYEVNFNPMLLQHVLLEDFRKEAPGIDVTNRLEQLDVSNLGFDDLHGNCSLASSPALRRLFPASNGGSIMGHKLVPRLRLAPPESLHID